MEEFVLLFTELFLSIESPMTRISEIKVGLKNSTLNQIIICDRKNPKSSMENG